MWTPEGLNGEMFAVTGRHTPAPPAGTTPPIAWGTEERWTELVGSQGVELEFRRELLVMEADDPATFLADFEANFGPLVMARRVLGDDGFAAVHDDLTVLYERHNTATDGRLHMEAEYLVAIGRKP
jgi:hypothetical protein